MNAFKEFMSKSLNEDHKITNSRKSNQNKLRQKSWISKRNGITKENSNGNKSENENFRMSQKNLRSKPHQQIARHRRENHRWWTDDRINLYLTQKKMLNQNNLSTKHPGNLWHYEKTKSLKNGNRGRRKKVKGVEICVNKVIEKGALSKKVYVQDQQRNYPWHIIIKTLSVQDEERILKYFLFK